MKGQMFKLKAVLDQQTFSIC